MEKSQLNVKRIFAKIQGFMVNFQIVAKSQLLIAAQLFEGASEVVCLLNFPIHRSPMIFLFGIICQESWGVLACSSLAHWRTTRPVDRVICRTSDVLGSNFVPSIRCPEFLISPRSPHSPDTARPAGRRRGICLWAGRGLGRGRRRVLPGRGGLGRPGWRCR